MKSIFDTGISDEIESRINTIDETSKAHWGKMDAFQMVKHCTLCDDMVQGKITIKRVFIGKLIGKMMLRKVLKDEGPFGKNSPTSPVLTTVSHTGDLNQQKKEWIVRIRNYDNYGNFNFVHPFFGSMSKEQIGVFVYKHADHHLRQFGA